MSGTSRDHLFAVTVSYLLVPNVLFLGSWLRPVWGLPAAAIVLACLVDVWRSARTDLPPLPRRRWAFVGAFALASTALAGIGGVNLQVTDYLKHNLLFHELAARPWPVVYPHGEPGGSLLCYYVAYYLPAGLAGKVLGLSWTAVASFVWGLAGVVLACAWIVRLGRPSGNVVLLAFTFVDSFAWLPGVYHYAQKLGILPGGLGGPWWAPDGFTEQIAAFGVPPMRLLFESEPTHLLWVPQHAIVAWLATACLLRVLQEGGTARHLGLVLGATLLWSPFVTVGLLPFVVMALLRDPKAALAWPGVAGGLALAVPVALYLLAHSSYQYVGFLPSHFSGVTDWLRFLLFLFDSVGVLGLAVALVRRETGSPGEGEWRLFVVAAAWLIATTLVVFGYQNDWVMRVSMPALMAFRLTVARLAVQLWHGAGHRVARAAFTVAVVLSADRPVKTCVLTAIGRLPCQGPQPTIVAVTQTVPTLADLPDTPDWDLSHQYLGSADGWFGRHMLRQPTHIVGPAR